MQNTLQDQHPTNLEHLDIPEHIITNTHIYLSLGITQQVALSTKYIAQ